METADKTMEKTTSSSAINNDTAFRLAVLQSIVKTSSPSNLGTCLLTDSGLAQILRDIYDGVKKHGLEAIFEPKYVEIYYDINNNPLPGANVEDKMRYIEKTLLFAVASRLRDGLFTRALVGEIILRVSPDHLCVLCHLVELVCGYLNDTPDNLLQTCIQKI